MINTKAIRIKLVFSAEEEVNNTKNFRLMKTVMIIMESMTPIQATPRVIVPYDRRIMNGHIDLVQDADQNNRATVEVHRHDILPIVLIQE